MAITRNFGNNNTVVDWTQELLVIPQQWGILGGAGLNLFMEEGVETNTVQFEQTTRDGNLIVDKVRGERATYGSNDASKVFSWTVPHFPHDDYISPNDIRGKRAYGSADEQETLSAVRTRKMERIMQNHAWTLEYARFQLLTAGTVYAPNGTVSMNFFTEFGATRKQIDFDLDTGTTDVLGKAEEAIAYIQDNASGENITEYVALCSPLFFQRLIGHANVKAAYQYYSSTQEPLRNRVGGTSIYRQFVYGNIRYIEVRGNYAGNLFIPAGDAVFLPMGTEIFKTFFGAANKFDLLGTLGERAYLFEYQSERGDKITLESESNFLNAVTRPAMVVRGYTG